MISQNVINRLTSNLEGIFGKLELFKNINVYCFLVLRAEREQR